MEKPRILLIEDNADTRKFIETTLSKEFEVLSAENGVLGIDFARNRNPDLILLDIMLPVLNGYDACSLLRKDERTRRIPIIFLSAKNTTADIIQGLTIGGDDYVSKPFSPRELVLRIKKILERKKSKDADVQSLTMGELTIDVPRHLASWKGKKIDLTATEFKLLTLLVQRRGRVQSRDQLLRDVWEYDSMIDTRTVDTHMRRLREKLGPAAKFLDTVRGVGYRFVE